MFFKMRSAYSVAAISAILTVAAVASAKYKAESPKVQMHAKGPAGMSIDGTSSTLNISEDDKTVNFTTFLNTIDTKNSKRNEHMQKRLGYVKKGDKDVEAFEIKLSVPKDKVDPKKGGSVGGTLTFHNQSKPVTVKYDVSGKHIHATFGFDVTKHGIAEEDLCFEPKTKSICAKTNVEVEVDFDLAG
jgi:hypothetical protein